MDTEITLPHCHYRRLENGVHEFVLLNNTRLAVNDFFSILENSPFARGEKVADVIRILVELDEPGMPPVSYMLQRYRDFMRGHKDHLPVIRTAYLYQSGFILSMVRSFMRLVTMPKQSSRRFFPSSERAQAESWLFEAVEAQPTTMPLP